MKLFDCESLDWKKMDGLIPAIIQDKQSGDVLMLGYMTEESLRVSLETKRVTFYSRSKKRLWQKGERSGHYLGLESIAMDCDGDSLLIVVTPEGPACHLGFQSCFQPPQHSSFSALHALIALIATRHHETSNEASYTQQLLSLGINRCAQKLGEEAVETVIAAISLDKRGLINESADLLYHWLVLLEVCQVSFFEIMECLDARRK